MNLPKRLFVAILTCIVSLGMLSCEQDTLEPLSATKQNADVSIRAKTGQEKSTINFELWNVCGLLDRDGTGAIIYHPVNTIGVALDANTIQNYTTQTLYFEIYEWNATGPPIQSRAEYIDGQYSEYYFSGFPNYTKYTVNVTTAPYPSQGPTAGDKNIRTGNCISGPEPLNEEM